MTLSYKIQEGTKENLNHYKFKILEIGYIQKTFDILTMSDPIVQLKSTE